MLGVDPGLRFAGFGIIKKEGGLTSLLDYGFLKMASTDSIPTRLSLLYSFFEQKIIRFEVSHLSLETPFLGKNAQNFLKLGYVRGILYLLANKYNLEICEFSPTQVKLSVTGSGGAGKEQVAYMIKKLFPKIYKELPVYDITDAVAVTLCGIWQQKVIISQT